MQHISEATQAVEAKLESLAIQSPTSRSQGSECESCKGVGWVRVEGGVTRCDCLKRRIAASHLAAIPELFRESTLENYIPIDELQESALARVKSNLSGSLLIFGNYGRGKTHLAVAQYKALVASGQSCAWRSMAELVHELRAAVVKDEFSVVRDRAKYADSFHLFIDDLDKYKPTEWTAEALHELFDLLYRRKLGVTVTTNFGLEALQEIGRLDHAIIRRLDAMCAAVEV